MHVRIKIEYLKVGMYVHKLEISWMQSPFWRKHFLVGTMSDIEGIKKTGVRHVIIDVSKGVGPEHANEVPAAARPAFTATGSGCAPDFIDGAGADSGDTQGISHVKKIQSRSHGDVR